jgi:gluconolactonase
LWRPRALANFEEHARTAGAFLSKIDIKMKDARTMLQARLRIFALGAILATLSTSSMGIAQTIGTIERLDPRFDALVPKDAVVERIAEGFDWSEGPVWDRAQGRLLFSDVPMNTVFQWKRGAGVSVFLKPSGYTGATPRGGEPGSNGLLMDSKGRLVLCQHGDRRVAVLESDRTFKTLADKYQGKRFNSPNDGVFHSNGDLFFTDPPYGLLGKNDDPSKELDFNGVYRLSAKDGSLTVVTKEMTYPNGITLSPDEKTLYVANSDPKKAIWMAYPLGPEGAVGKGRVFADVTSLVGTKKGLPDGMKVDVAGNLFASGPGGILVFASDGTHLGTFNTGEATANCGWGEDGSVLYITADMYIGRVPLTTRGNRY